METQAASKVIGRTNRRFCYYHVFRGVGTGWPGEDYQTIEKNKLGEKVNALQNFQPEQGRTEK